jgi:ketosteroid isomerase-like protein
MKLLSIVFIVFSLHYSISAQTNIDQELITDSMRVVFHNNMQEWMKAYNGGDANNLMPLYTDDAEYFSAHVKGLVAKGRNRLIENFQNGMSMGGHIDKVEILSINYSCNLATLVCKYEATNSGQKAIGRNLIVLKKVNNTWLIITHMTVV